MPNNPPRPVTIRYTNHRGETANRRIVPVGIRFGTTEWHTEPQWLLQATDLDRDATRTFAMKDIMEWGRAASLRPAEPPPTFTTLTIPLPIPRAEPNSVGFGVTDHCRVCGTHLKADGSEDVRGLCHKCASSGVAPQEPQEEKNADKD
jgi:hypothetical protein